jgi:hypothetical protein
MGTRSLLVFQERYGDKLLVYVIIYQQYDGYPSGVGKMLSTFLKKVRLINGIRGGEPDPEKIECNGFDDLVARFIRLHKKDEPGNFYIVPEQSGYGEEFTYYVTFINGKDLSVKVNESEEMTLDQFEEFCK